jgi:hypothetical protein
MFYMSWSPSLLQRGSLSHQPGTGSLQPALGIIPTLFGMQQAPGGCSWPCAPSAHLQER